MSNEVAQMAEKHGKGAGSLIGQSVKRPRRKVVSSSKFNLVSHHNYALTLECGHVIGANRVSKTAACRLCA